MRRLHDERGEVSLARLNATSTDRYELQEHISTKLIVWLSRTLSLKLPAVNSTT
ncbi:MAG: hypothetical protein ACPG4T_14650 [Nannocystaceae bacterium]